MDEAIVGSERRVRARMASIGVLVPLLLTSCAAASAQAVARAEAAPGARFAAEASAFATRAAEAADTTRAAAVADVVPFLGRPLHRAPFATDEVALTLDDGPSKHTTEVLDIFERYDVRATFFWVGGRTRGHEQEVARAYRAGFEIGNHTWDHQEIRREPLSFDLAEIDRCQRQFASIVGTGSVWVRPPAGHWDENTMRAAGERGMVVALWSLHGQDTGPGTHAERIARGVISEARGGDVILLHETNPETVKALPAIIEGLRRKGLKPVTLSELLTR